MAGIELPEVEKVSNEIPEEVPEEVPQEVIATNPTETNLEEADKW